MPVCEQMSFTHKAIRTVPGTQQMLRQCCLYDSTRPRPGLVWPCSMLHADCPLARSLWGPHSRDSVPMYVPQRPECYFPHRRWQIRNMWIEVKWFSLHFPGYLWVLFYELLLIETLRGPRWPNFYVGSRTERLWALSTHLARDHDISMTGLRSKPRAPALHLSTICSWPLTFLSFSFLIWGKGTGRSNLQGCGEDYERHYTWKY